LIPRRIDAARVAPMPWRNGLGATRELASDVDADGTLVWRLSLATLDRDAPFSAFPGMDRLLVALGAAELHIDCETHVLAQGDQVRFAGEAEVHARVPAPTRALNVMTRRGAAHASVTLRATLGTTPSATDLRDVVDLTVDLGTTVAEVRIRRG